MGRGEMEGGIPEVSRAPHFGKKDTHSAVFIQVRKITESCRQGRGSKGPTGQG